MARVLVVDDEPDIRLLLHLQLQASGHLVEEAEGGEEAVSKVGAEAFDAVLLDLRMPDVDGWEVLERIGGAERLAALPVIIVSAHADARDEARARALGCRRLLRKPYSVHDLHEELDRVLGTA